MTTSFKIYEVLPRDLDWGKPGSQDLAILDKIQIKEIDVQFKAPEAAQKGLGSAEIVYANTEDRIEGRPFASLEDAEAGVEYMLAPYRVVRDKYVSHLTNAEDKIKKKA